MFLRHFIFRRVVTETCTHFPIFHTNRMYTLLLNAIRRLFSKTRYPAWILVSMGMAFFLIAFLQKHPKKAKIYLSPHQIWDPAKIPLLPLRNVNFSKISLDPAVKERSSHILQGDFSHVYFLYVQRDRSCPFGGKTGPLGPIFQSRTCGSLTPPQAV